ncbi:MAG TPA: biotin/lipoyl-binding protein, partial [Vicinamibacteria bacterium]|nr:biotin/lipoyl-binding protein [Vicinamibacteria bacterium]
MSTDLKGELASLKIDRNRKAASPWRWPLLLFVPVLLGLGVLYALRLRQALAAPEVQTVTAAIQTTAPGAGSGTPVLSASGYIVARRKAVVSAKIQGRLSWLGVEEGSVVREGQVFARLESNDYEASVERAKAAVQHAEADLAENQRQLRVAEDLTRQSVIGTDSRDAT